MNFQLTQAAINALAINPGLRPATFKLGSGTGYVPSLSDTDIHGTLIYASNLSAEDVITSNVIRYSVVLGYDVGPFAFGEVGLFTSTGILFALGVADVVLNKYVVSSPEGANALRLDAYLSNVGTAYDMWLNVAETSNTFQMAVLNSVDELPPGSGSVPAAYIIRGRTLATSFRAYIDGYGLWNFDEYTVGTDEGVVVTADLMSITLPLSAYFSYTGISSDGDLLIEFITGTNYSIVRTVHAAIISGPNITLSYLTPLNVAPIPGDMFIVFVRNSIASAAQFNNLPIASVSTLGAVKIGSGISIATDGTISSLPATYLLPPSTTSVLGGVITGAGLSVNSGGTLSLAPAGSTLGGVKAGTNISIASDGTISSTASYTLPIASPTVLGGVKVGAGLSVDGTGVLSAAMISVSGQTGVVVVQAQNNNAATGTSLIVDGGATTGTIKLKTIVAGANISLAADANGNLEIIGAAGAYTLPVATSSVLGGVKQGSNVTIAGDGTISVAAPTTYTLPVATTTILGGVKQGTNITIAGDGTISSTASGYTLPVATASVLGGVIIGANITVAGDGTISVAAPYTLPIATASVLGGVKQGANVTIAGDGTISVPAPSTYTLPVATASVLGGVKQGSNVTIAGDGTLSVAAPYTLPVATSSVLGGVKQGANVTIAGDGTISVAAPSSYTLPIASATILGGIMVGTGLSINGSGVLSATGTAPVTSVSGQTGVVVIQAQDNNAATGTSLISDGGSTTGTVKLKTLVQGANVTIAPDVNGNLSISASTGTTYTLPVATASVLGGVKQGSNVTIAGDGTISVAAPPATYVLPVATASVLGGVKQGSNVTIAGDGTISVAAPGGVTSFNSRAGAVTLVAADVSGVGGALVGSGNTFTAANSFTGGSITVPTQTTADSSLNAASTAFVHAAIGAAVVTGVPANGNGFIDGILEQWNVNTTFSLTAGQTSYTADMWMNYSGLSGAATVTRQFYAGGLNTAGSVEPPKYFLQHSQTSAATDNPFIQQKLESARKYAGQSATFSVCLTAGAALTITGINVIQNFGTGGSPSAAVTTSVPVTWAVTTSEQRFSVRLDIPSVASKTFGVQFSDTLAVQLLLPSGQTFLIQAGMFQIEPSSATSSSNTTGTGGSPSAFNYLGYAIEQARTRRYIAYVTCTGIVATGVAASTAVAYGPSQRFPVPMLKSPSITVTGVSYFDTAAPGGTGTATGTGINLEEYYLQINASGRTTWTAGYFGVSTAGTLLFDARP